MIWPRNLFPWGAARREAEARPPAPPPASRAMVAPIPVLAIRGGPQHPGGTLGPLADALAREAAGG